MNWATLRLFPWVDTRARFVSQTKRCGTLLDIGSSDGETLGHLAELRPDLRLRAVDKFGQPEKYPAGCEFQCVDVESGRFGWPDTSVDVVTCMHLVEHLERLDNLFSEIARLLKPGGRAYFETPHPKTLHLPSLRGVFTMNFYDDPTHTKIVTTETLASHSQRAGLETEATGVSRNWIFAASHPLFAMLPPSRKKYTARVHWIGWSSFLIARKPA